MKRTSPSVAIAHDKTKTTSAYEMFVFRRHDVLEMTNRIDEPGHLNLKMATCLFVAWVLVYFCIWKGIRTTGKVVYVTATLPYVFLLILFTRAVTLPGSLDGIMYYITPIWTRLADPKVNTPIYILGGTLPHFSAGRLNAEDHTTTK